MVFNVVLLFQFRKQARQSKGSNWSAHRRNWPLVWTLGTVAQLMEHSTIQMTMRYAHLAPEHNQVGVDRLVSPGVSSEQVVTKPVTGKKSKKRNGNK